MDSRICMFLLSLLFSSCAFASKCPSEHLIRPCFCSDGTALVCENIVGQDILNGVFRRLGDSKVIEFILRASEVNHIPSSSLEKNKFQRIRVLDSTLDQLFDRRPSRDNRLTQLGLENVKFRRGFRIRYLKPLQRLEVLLVRDTEIPKLGKDFSENLSPLIRLVALLRTKTRSIDYAFVGKQRLVDVRVQNASISTLLRASFPFPSPSLRSLSFDENQIESLPSDQFEQMSNLIRLTLANNRISEVSESVFGSIYDQLRFLILEGNPIKCDCSIKWITEKGTQGKTITGKCVEPQTLAGKNIADLTSSDFPNC